MISFPSCESSSVFATRATPLRNTFSTDLLGRLMTTGSESFSPRRTGKRHSAIGKSFFLFFHPPSLFEGNLCHPVGFYRCSFAFVCLSFVFNIPGPFSVSLACPG